MFKTIFAELTMQRLLMIPSLLLIPLLFNGISITLSMVAKYQAADRGFAPMYSDLWITAVALTVMCVLRKTIVPFVFVPLGDWILPSCAEKAGRVGWDEAGRKDRVVRFGTVCFKLSYFVMITTWGFSFLRHTSWWPPVLGGNGLVVNAFVGHPFAPLSANLKYYYLIQLAYHVQSLLFHVTMHHRNDFVEMTLHHCCAIFLVFFSYFNGFAAFGSIVYFLHDVADVVGYAVKASVDTKYTKVTLSIYVTLLAVWAYTRLYVFPMFVIYCVHYEGLAALSPDWTNTEVYSYLETMLFMLQGLHAYWYLLFLAMGYKFLATGETKDTQQKCGEKAPPVLLSLSKLNTATSSSSSSSSSNRTRAKVE